MKFVVTKGSNGQFRFNLVAGNGQVVATSESYQRKTSALTTIASIQKDAASGRLTHRLRLRRYGCSSRTSSPTPTVPRSQRGTPALR